MAWAPVPEAAVYEDRDSGGTKQDVRPAHGRKFHVHPISESPSMKAPADPHLRLSTYALATRKVRTTACADPRSTEPFSHPRNPCHTMSYGVMLAVSSEMCEWSVAQP